MDVCENMGEYPVGLSPGDLEIVDDEVGELYLAHAWCLARYYYTYFIRNGLHIHLDEHSHLSDTHRWLGRGQRFCINGEGDAGAIFGGKGVRVVP